MKRKGADATPRVSKPPGALSADDAALWSYAVRKLQPLRKAKARVVSSPAEPLPKGDPTSDAAATRPAAAPKPRPAVRRDAEPVAPPRPPPPLLTDLDRRRLRKLASGRTGIEARVDLHGLRQGDAHRRLRAFLLDAQARGLRSVLVITGKGGRAPAGQGAPAELSGEARGVIRRNIPVWLGAPDLRSIVVGFTPAHARHGGEGALYVQLRRRRS